jgi:hypothetical protein
MHLGEPTIPISWYGCRIEHAESLTIIPITAKKYLVPVDLPMTMKPLKNKVILSHLEDKIFKQITEVEEYLT